MVHHTHRQIGGVLLGTSPLIQELHCTYSYQHAENSPYPCERHKPFKALEETISTFLISFIMTLETSGQFNYLCLNLPLYKINVIFCA